MELMDLENLENSQISSALDKIIKRNNPSRIQRVLSALLLVLCFLIVVLVVCFCLMLLHPKLLHDWASYYLSWESKCLSPVCITQAADTMRRMDKSVDPCTDFYQFSCGGLDNKYNVIPDQDNTLGTTSVSQLEIDKRIKVLIEEIEEKDESHYKTKIKTVYSSCMNTIAIKKQGIAPLVEIFDLLGKWPVVLGSQWNESQFSLEQTLVQMRRYGYMHDFLAKVTVDPVRGIYNVRIGQPDLDFDSIFYYLNSSYDSVLQRRLNFMVKAAVELGATASLQEIKEELQDVLNFQKKIAKLIDTVSSDASWANLTKLQETANYINWTYYMNATFKPVWFSDTYRFDVKNPSLLSNVSALISSLDKRTLANYIGWRVVASSAALLTDKWVSDILPTWEPLSGRIRVGSRWEACIRQVRNYFDLGVSALYAQITKREEKEEQTSLVLKIMNHIQESFVESLGTSLWMDDEAKLQAINKTRKMTAHVGYPIELLNDTILNDYYNIASVSRYWTYFFNILMLQKFETTAMYWNAVNRRIKDWKKFINVTYVNAYYNDEENAIRIPLSTIQAYQVNSKRPMYLNFGNIGWTIGHEIMHGFDNFGIFYNEDGKYISWVVNDTEASFNNKSNCFKKQYETYDVPDTNLRINGSLTLPDNIADNGGLRYAFKAYKNYMKGKPEEPGLPGLDYTVDQLFFIQAAGKYCAKRKIEVTEDRLKHDSHSPARFRIIGTMSNMDEFAQAFKCKLGSPMNPPVKCRLW